ncbi:metallophosphoesterase [Wenyingzhuangia sp. 2_MG-2023]|nr:metallophosphoesterase [Wenyingzhuangia sp. 2_MG-2023]MDO6738127.1 metallophosphoesterase [Wenyingzhuangia sp. 2_MG-2023]
MKSIYKKKIFLFLPILLLISCATYEKQISNQFKNWNSKKTSTSPKKHTVYLIGDAGNSPKGNKTLQNLKTELDKEGKNSTVLFLGDNVYPKGISPKKGAIQDDGIDRLNSQLNILNNFKGKTIFIPGNHDWYYGLDGLKKQEKHIEQVLGKNSFLPENGCPLEVVSVNEQIDIIIIDSQWFITDWNKHPKMNDKCDEIKTLEKFFVELEGLINKSQDKVTLIAIHHPLVSKGTHGGEASFKQHIFPFSNNIPLPVLGTLIHTFRKTSGLNPQDLQGKRYEELIARVNTLAQEHDRLLLVSGHDHNMQYLFSNGIPQIISGSGSKTSPTYLGKNNGFTYGENGYVKLSILEDKEVIADFKSNNQTVFKTTVFESKKQIKQKKYDTSNIPKEVTAQIYPKSLTQKNKFYKSIWGDHYRDIYSKQILAPTVLLDTLYGGLTLVKKGGGHQSKSLRLKDKNGKQYVMRALKKSAIRFLQTVAFKKDYISDKMKGTYTENLLYDFYTSAHPYTPFVVGDLSDPIGVLHTNPKLFYVPKQNTLIPFDDEFGNALYMIEERPEDGHKDLSSFGFPDDIISTDDLFAELRDSKNNKLDEKNYVTARLFDMILGDWDRHVDQWRWAVFEDGKHKTFKPIPRDRDQAFSNYDGFILKSLTTMVDAIKLMQTYDKEIRNLFKFNDEPYPIDVSLLQESDYSLWNEQALFIKENLTDEVIENAFSKLQDCLQDPQLERIKSVLKYRRDHVVNIAKAYRKILEEFAIVKGTDKDEYFEISATKEKTIIKVFNIKDGEKEDLHFTREFDNKKTKEIWVYGLDDDNFFCVLNTHPKSPKIRLIGGQNKDTYHVEKSAKRIRIHDFISKNNIYKGPLKKHLSDRYDNNVYEYRKVKDHTQTFIPLIAYNPDDGFAIGTSLNRTYFGYNRHPFTNKHDFSIKYFTATQGFDFSHKSEFATYLNHWNAFVKTRLTSSNFSNNFFGYGNNTDNNDNNLGLNYNRVKSEIKSIEPGMTWNNLMGTAFSISIPLTIYELEETEGRYLNSLPIEFDEQNYVGLKTSLYFENYDSSALPTLGFDFNIDTGWDYNLSKESSLTYLKTNLGILLPISLNKQWILSTKIRSQFNFGNDFQLYQSAFIGGNNGLRGFRNERFSGKQSFVQNTNLRYTIDEIKTPILPLTYGLSLGYDYGRVWLPNENSDRWHTSYGTTLWASAPGAAKINLNFFNSKEGLRFTFGVGVNW